MAEGLSPSRVRRLLPALCIASATLLAVVAASTTWVRAQALDTDEWVEQSAQLLEDPAVTDALAVFVVDEIYTALDIQGEFSSILPEDFDGLAGPLSAALRGPATEATQRLVASDRFRATWVTANRVAHQSIVNILRDETRTGVSATDGAVTLELGDLVRVVAADLGLSEGLVDRLPAEAGRVTLIESDQLETAQAAVRVLDFLSWFVLLVVVALYALGVFLARDRIRALRNVGLGLVGAAVFVLIARAVSTRIAIDAIVEDPRGEPAANVVAAVMTGLLRQIAWSGLIYGLVILAFASAMGDRPGAVALRRNLAPFFNATAGAVAGATAVAIVALLWWSPGRAFEGWATGLTLLGLIIGAVVAIRRRTLHEFPDERIDALVDRFRGRFRARPVVPTVSAAGSDTVGTQLESLRMLHDAGELTDSEYAAAKQRVLGVTA
ncbi:MAG: SHOCT domain-containing protein [Acidimicrobiales bacterium]